MTTKDRRLSIWAGAVAFTITVATFTGPRQSMAASIEDVAMMKSADRQKILIEGAKKEGKDNVVHHLDRRSGGAAGERGF